jgi:DNA modification methylase
MIRPYYEEGQIRLYHGDCLDLLMDLPPDVTFGAVIGDPPYCSGGRNQQQARQTFEKSGRNEWFLTDQMGSDSYTWWMRSIAGLLFMRATVGAHCYLFTDWRQFSNLTIAVETKGWTLRNVVVWDKDKGGAMGSFWRNNHEWVPVFSKGPPTPVPDGTFFNTWRGIKPHDDEHPTVKPLELIKYLMKASSGAVLDPWCGMGTTLLAAKQLGRPAIGIEIVERYCELTANALRRCEVQKELPL